MATSRKKPARKTAARRPASTATLRQPNWRHWMVRPLSIRQATLITMGWEPMAGVIGLLRGRPLKLDELRQREAAFEAALQTRELARFNDGALPVISLRQALEFAHARGWTLHKAVPRVLERIMHLEASRDSNKPESVGPLKGRRPAQDSQLTEIRPVPAGAPYSALGARGGKADEAGSRLERTLLRTVGALAVVLKEIATNGKGAQFLKGSRLNISAVAEHVAATVGQAAGSGGVIPGYTVRTMQQHISNALKEYYQSKRDLFDLDPADPPAE